MSKKKVRRQKHVPQRTCVGCRSVSAKRELLRLVRTPEGVVFDPTGRIAGRGAYLHPNMDCLQKGIKGPLARALKVELSAEDQSRLSATLAALLDEGRSLTGKTRVGEVEGKGMAT